MLRIFKYTRKGLFFFKRIRIGIKLIRSSLKTITFEHNKYFIFCLIITFIQLFRIILTNYIDPKLSKNLLITEFLSGQSFFEILIDYLKLPISGEDLKIIFFKNIIFFFELIIFYFTNTALAFYVFQNLTIVKSFKKSLQKLKLIFLWVIIEMIILFMCALLGFIGDILQFIWQLSTALIIQIIAFESNTILKVLRYNFIYFKKMFGNILGIDLFLDSVLVVLSALFYHIYKTNLVPTFSFLNNADKTNFFIIVIIFYIISTIQVLETITFTKLYRYIKK